MKKRLDQHLVDLGLCPSKTKAQEMIEAGQVSLQIGDLPPTLAKKSSQSVDISKTKIHIAQNNVLKYVSRAGFKLEGALEDLDLDVLGIRVLDVGQSTGGFTDCLLQKGARHVTGVDVATDELAQGLVGDPRVTALTGINARDLRRCESLQGLKFDLIVVDVSFISLEKILPELVPYLSLGGRLLALVKPQFEVGSANINKKGVVKSTEAIMLVEKKLVGLANFLELVGIRYFPARIKGRDGNQEFFLYAEKKK